MATPKPAVAPASPEPAAAEPTEAEIAADLRARCEGVASKWIGDLERRLGRVSAMELCASASSDARDCMLEARSLQQLASCPAGSITITPGGPDERTAEACRVVAKNITELRTRAVADLRDQAGEACQRANADVTRCFERASSLEEMTTCAPPTPPPPADPPLAAEADPCSLPARIDELDVNSDSVIDLWKHVVTHNGTDVMICRRADLNYDGKVDVQTSYDSDGKRLDEQFDFDFDGNFDARKVYDPATDALVDTQSDTDGDGVWDP